MRTYQTDPRGQAPLVTWRQWLLPLGAAAGIVASWPCHRAPRRACR
jgi:hypothetical protein